MFRRIVPLLAVPVAALGIALTAPGTAAAEPHIDCTATGTVDTPKFTWNGNGFDHVGTTHKTHIGNGFGGLFSTLRVWHVTFQAKGSSFSSYVRAYAARCQSDGTKTGEIDLTRTPEQTLSEFDQRCGTADFTLGSTNYHYIGFGSSIGFFKPGFYYWSTTPSSGSLTGGVTAGRCP
jgi:hypothetical protein